MPKYPNKEEFSELLMVESLDSILENHLLGGIPYSFSEQPEIYDQMIRRISRGLRVPMRDICIVGSARIGFSLTPDRFGEPFSERSDIDIIIVSQELFDPSWLDILTTRRVSWSTLRSSTRNGLISHRKSDYIFNGWIYPNLVADAIEIGEKWISTFNGLSQIPVLSSRKVGGRLYRTWEHAKYYHLRSLSQVREKVAAFRN